MTLDLAPPTLLNSAGGLAFVCAGAFALRHARGQRGAQLAAVLALSFGLTYVVGNLWRPDDAAGLGASVLLQAILAVATLAMILHVARGLTRASRRWLVVLASVSLLGPGAAFAYTAEHRAEIAAIAEPGQPPDVASSLMVAVGAFVVSTTLLGILVGALALAYRDTPATRGAERRSIAFHACAYGLFVVFATSFIVPVHLPINLGALVALGCVVAWALASDGPVSRNVTLALIAASGAGLAVSVVVFQRGLAWSADFGIPGLLRTLGAALLAIAVVRYGHAALDGDRGAVRARAPLAIAALAALLIVAQVAQNFLSAQYSLLVGGLVSGAFIVAARPLERALERRAESATPTGADRAARERSYRAAARKFLRDGYLSREEERELVILAEHLGIPVARAYEIRDEVEAEAKQPD